MPDVPRFNPSETIYGKPHLRNSDKILDGLVEEKKIQLSNELYQIFAFENNILSGEKISKSEVQLPISAD